VEIAADGAVHVWMTLTAPTCPVAGTLPGEVARAVAGVEGTGEVTVELVWDPPWSKDRMSEDAKLALDRW
jgi:metal-sulfur cluster biosynthetic enzyme